MQANRKGKTKRCGGALNQVRIMRVRKGTYAGSRQNKTLRGGTEPGMYYEGKKRKYAGIKDHC